MDNNKNYEIRYLPIFEKDLSEIIDYITFQLRNPEAARSLIHDVEKSILDRLPFPLSFEPFQSLNERENIYYRIYVKSYTIYYVVIGNVMEVRRILYNKRNTDKLI